MTLACRECRGMNLLKFGFVRGRQRYKCTDCSKLLIIKESKKDKTSDVNALAVFRDVADSVLNRKYNMRISRGIRDTHPLF